MRGSPGRQRHSSAGNTALRQAATQGGRTAATGEQRAAGAQQENVPAARLKLDSRAGVVGASTEAQVGAAALHIFCGRAEGVHRCVMTWPGGELGWPGGWPRSGRYMPKAAGSRMARRSKAPQLASYERVAAAVQVLAVRQVGPPGHDQQQAVAPPAPFPQLCSVQGGNGDSWHQSLPQAVQRTQHGACARSGAAVHEGGGGCRARKPPCSSGGGGGWQGGGLGRRAHGLGGDRMQILIGLSRCWRW